MKTAKQPPAPPPAPQSRGRARPASFGDFIPDQSLTEVDRAAQFLDWAAQNMPMRFVPYTWITKHAIIRPRVPGPDDPMVASIRKKIGAIKRSLWDRYGRRSVPAPRGQELGIRATVDDDDIAGTDFLANKRRVHNGIRRLQDTRSKIDPARMRDHGLKSMVQNMDPVLKKLTSGDLMNRLKELPPRRDGDDD